MSVGGFFKLIGRAALKHIWLILLVIVGGLLVRYMFFAPIPAAGEEVLSKRTLTSRTYSNGDGSYKLEAFGAPIHFYDGWRYQLLEEAAEPDIEVAVQTIEQKPNDLSEAGDLYNWQYGEYDLHKKVIAGVEQENTVVVFRDAKKDVIFTLPVYEARDADEERSFVVYQVNYNDHHLMIYIKVPKEYLETAKYPVTLKPYQPTAEDLEQIQQDNGQAE